MRLPLVPGSILQVWSAKCIYRHAVSVSDPDKLYVLTTESERVCASESREIAPAAFPWPCAWVSSSLAKAKDLRIDQGLMDFVGTDPLMLQTIPPREPSFTRIEGVLLMGSTRASSPLISSSLYITMSRKVPKIWELTRGWWMLMEGSEVSSDWTHRKLVDEQPLALLTWTKFKLHP